MEMCSPTPPSPEERQAALDKLSAEDIAARDGCCGGTRFYAGCFMLSHLYQFGTAFIERSAEFYVAFLSQ